MPAVTLREIAYHSADYQQSLDLRYIVLRQPLHLTFTAADLANDAADIHLAAFSTPTAEPTGTASSTTTATAAPLLATLILQPLQPRDTRDPPAIKMRQVAVAPHVQGQGIGRKLVSWSEEVARQRGYGLMLLHARKPAVAFYARLGYRCVGGEFAEVGIPHQKMEKVLS